MLRSALPTYFRHLSLSLGQHVAYVINTFSALDAFLYIYIYIAVSVYVYAYVCLSDKHIKTKCDMWVRIRSLIVASLWCVRVCVKRAEWPCLCLCSSVSLSVCVLQLASWSPRSASNDMYGQEKQHIRAQFVLINAEFAIGHWALAKYKAQN